MEEILGEAHEFLRNFCLSNTQNQALLHKHLDLFLTPGVSFSNILSDPEGTESCHFLSSPRG